MDDSSNILSKEIKVHIPIVYHKIITNNINESLNIKELTYKTETNKLKNRINNLLGNIDIYEDKKSNECIPDYKFPEIRWDENIKFKNQNALTDNEIKNKFQLLTNQSKEQKMEVCKNCYETGKRGIAFDIPFFYKGTENWDNKIPTKGKAAEIGCEGCAWYDFAKWRKELIKIIETN